MLNVRRSTVRRKRRTSNVEHPTSKFRLHPIDSSRSTISVAAMKLCFSTLVCPAWSLEQIVAAAPPAGIEGIDFRGLGEEIDITKLAAFDEHLDATLKLLGWHGLSMPCLCLSVTLISPAPQRWQQMLEEFHRAAQLAAKTKST